MKNAWNQEINLKKKGKRDLPASKDKNLAKILKENNKKWMVEPRANAEREKRKELFEKNFEKVQIWPFFKKLIHEFRSVENHPRSVKTDRDSLSSNFKNFDRSKNRMNRSNKVEAHHIFEEKHNFWKTKKIKLKALKFKNKNAWVWDDMISKSRILSPKFPKTKFLAISTNFQATN